MNRTIKFTIAFSLVIHLAFLWPWPSHAPQQPVSISPAKDQTVEITLTQAKPKVIMPPIAEPEPEDKPPPPRHTEDDIEKANSSDGVAEKAGGKPSQKKQKGEFEPKPEVTVNKQLIANQSISNKASYGASDDIEVLSKRNNKSDGNGANEEINDEQEEKPRWYNETLKRLTEQISYIYVKPEGVSKYAKGTIKFKIDQQGYLLTSWIDTPSGNWALDEAVLRAIKGVIRYQIPNSPRQYKFYKEITINYSGS